MALAPMCPATSARQDRHLLAASTLRCVMLLDLRRPQQALLKWPHSAYPSPAMACAFCKGMGTLAKSCTCVYGCPETIVCRPKLSRSSFV